MRWSRKNGDGTGDGAERRRAGAKKGLANGEPQFLCSGPAIVLGPLRGAGIDRRILKGGLVDPPGGEVVRGLALACALLLGTGSLSTWRRHYHRQLETNSLELIE